MQRLSRRSFLAATAATAALAAPALPRRAAAEEVEVVIVGAGAAGIAAARRLAAANRKFVLLEAADRLGGRCLTDTARFGVPVDLGAHRLHMPDGNPVAKLAPATGLEVYPAPRGQKVRIGRRYARAGELEDFLAALVRAGRAIAEAARGKTDVACARALPRDLGDWQGTIDFALGPYACGSDLSDVSAMDYARLAERDIDAFCRQGVGALIAKLGAGLPVRLATPATSIEWRRDVEVATPSGRFGARAVIVTASTGVLAANKIAFAPDLPKRHVEAVGQLRLGNRERVMLELAGNPLGLQRDDLVFEKADDKRTAALLANVSGTSLATLDIGGSFGRSLAAKGETAMIGFARDWLTQLYGDAVAPAIKRGMATRWDAEPWILGASSVAVPGGHGARRVLMEPLRDRVFFAGEAAHETLWGTVGGAWESGERAASAVLKLLKPLPVPRKEPPPQRRHRR